VQGEDIGWGSDDDVNFECAMGGRAYSEGSDEEIKKEVIDEKANPIPTYRNPAEKFLRVFF
jgi:hypothetical protein